jgi:hypothetical protein
MADDANATVTRGLLDQATIKQLSSSGDAAKQKRLAARKDREEREKKEAEEAKKAAEEAEAKATVDEGEAEE